MLLIRLCDNHVVKIGINFHHQPLGEVMSPRTMCGPSLIRKKLFGPDVHVYKAGRLYLKDFFFSPKRPCSVTLKGRTLTVSEAARNTKCVYCLKNATLMVQHATKKLVIELENKQRLLFFVADEDELRDWVIALSDSIHWKIQRYYALGDELGQGAFATVSKGWCKKNGEPVAIKVIDKTSCSYEDFIYLQREVDISQKLYHSNVVRTMDLFESEKKVFFVLEYVGGGTLQAFGERRGSITEQEARRIMRDIFTGIEYIHSKRVAHRDIKPENILCTAEEFPMTVKLTDFGLARNLDPNTEKTEDRYDFEDAIRPDGLMNTPVGTPKFVAPEILTNSPYGEAIDLFASGIVMYWLLCGYVPFDHPNADRLIELIKRAELEFPSQDWASVSKEAKELISALLSRNPSGRPTAKEALRYPWFVVQTQVTNMTPESKQAKRGLVETGIFLKHSGSRKFLHQLSRSSETDDVDDISQVIRLKSGVAVSTNGSST